MEQLLENFSLDLFVKQTVLFLILIGLMVKFAWKPILNALNDREEGIEKSLAEAAKAREEMQNINADNDRILKESRSERDAMIKEAREIKESMISEAKEEAKAQATKLIEQAKTTIQNEKLAAITDLKNQVADLSIDIAEKVMKEELSSKDKQVALVEKMLGDIELN